MSIVRAIARAVLTSLSQGRAILRQIHQLGLEDIGADAELDIVQPGTALSEFYRLSLAATSEPLISAGVQQKRRQNWMICVPGPSCSARQLAARIRRSGPVCGQVSQRGLVRIVTWGRAPLMLGCGCPGARRSVYQRDLR